MPSGGRLTLSTDVISLDGHEPDPHPEISAGEHVLIAVTDKGPGIPRDQHRLIFEKFGRADVPGGSKPGTGLGLFIARSIAEAHGGTLEVRVRPTGGSVFELTLPTEMF